MTQEEIEKKAKEILTLLKGVSYEDAKEVVMALNEQMKRSAKIS